MIDQAEFSAMSADDQWRHFRDAQELLAKGVVMPCSEEERVRFKEMADIYTDGDVGDYVRSWAMPGLKTDEEENA